MREPVTHFSKNYILIDVPLERQSRLSKRWQQTVRFWRLTILEHRLVYETSGSMLGQR